MAWYHIPGNDQDVVIRTRVRLARNLSEYPFVTRLEASHAKEIVGRTGCILEKNGFTRIDFSDISRSTAQSLVEKHYASPAFVRESLPHALFLNEPCNLSVMACEEDHLRLQCILPGFSLKDSYAGVSRIETQLDEEIAFAFDPKLGYLTECPANVGTAMRASIMLCLPMLSVGGRLTSLSLQLGQMGLLLQEMCGESRSFSGGIYQLSNRVTLGLSEEEILDRLQHATAEIIAMERRSRTSISGYERDKLLDRVFRSEGILRHAHTLTAAEMLELLTDLRLGASLGMSNVKIDVMTSLLVEGMPATLSLECEVPPKLEHDSEILRAKMVKEKLFGT